MFTYNRMYIVGEMTFRNTFLQVFNNFGGKQLNAINHYFSFSLKLLVVKYRLRFMLIDIISFRLDNNVMAFYKGS